MKTNQAGSTKPQQIVVDVLFVGGGPATLGLLCNAAKTNR